MGKIILDIRISKIERTPDTFDLTRAYVDLIINDALIIKGVRVVVNKQHGTKPMLKQYGIVMPREDSKRKWYEAVRFLNKNVKEQIEDKIITAFKTL